MNILLASSSPYRKALLNKLQIPFSCFSPNIDETKVKDESIQTQVARLAKAKAMAGYQPENADQFIIGSDQLASFNNQAVGKPGNFENAQQQLRLFSGHTVTFYTAICVLRCSDQKLAQSVEQFEVKFRQLSDKQISTYLRLEQPFDCAGSFKCEGLGISLFSAMQGNDPNSLVGLPLIRLIDLFADLSVDLFDYMGKP
ncbi:Maf family protein [Paraglaciecola aestuariivivens]